MAYIVFRMTLCPYICANKRCTVMLKQLCPVCACTIATSKKENKQLQGSNSYKSPSLSFVPPKGSKRLLLIITPNNSSQSTKNPLKENRKLYEHGWISLNKAYFDQHLHAHRHF